MTNNNSNLITLGALTSLTGGSGALLYTSLCNKPHTSVKLPLNITMVMVPAVGCAFLGGVCGGTIYALSVYGSKDENFLFNLSMCGGLGLLIGGGIGGGVGFICNKLTYNSVKLISDKFSKKSIIIGAVSVSILTAYKWITLLK